MHMICPECMGPLATADGKTARCTIHGGEYRIMFAREPSSAEEEAGPAIDPIAAASPCAFHPQVQAVHLCAVCQAPICATCDFAFPGGVHVCPTCASKPQAALGKGRQKSLIISYALAVWCSLGVAVLFSGVLAGTAHSKSDLQALGGALMILLYIPAIVGTAMAFSAVDRRLATPASVWVSVVWNGLILAVLLLLAIIGILK